MVDRDRLGLWGLIDLDGEWIIREFVVVEEGLFHLSSLSIFFSSFQVTSNTAIYYDPDPKNTCIEEDEEWVGDCNVSGEVQMNSARDLMVTLLP